jgi:hypothetical protein
MASRRFLSGYRDLIEAKREDIYFELPAGPNKRVRKLSTVVEDNEQIDDAVRQCLSYCLDRGTPFGAICNGHQIIAFVGSRTDGVSPLEGHCLVFASLDEMLSDFRTLWDNISKPAVISYALHSTLKADTASPPPEKLSQRIAGYPGFKNRNPFQTDLKILGELFIEDVIQAPQLEVDFLKKAYCPSGALSQYALISKQILQARYSSLFEKEIAGPTLQPAQTKHGLSEDFGTDVLAASLKRRAIVLLGDVGVGKTIFIRNLIKVAARDVFEKALILYVDFGKEPALAEDLESFVPRRCAAQLRQDHEIDIEDNKFIRGVYHSDLARFAKGIYGGFAQSEPKTYLEREIEFLHAKLRDEPGHLRACLTHISKAHLRQIVIFLDNVDQRPIDFQDRVFLNRAKLCRDVASNGFYFSKARHLFPIKNEGVTRGVSAPSIHNRATSHRSGSYFALGIRTSSGRTSRRVQGFGVRPNCKIGIVKQLYSRTARVVPQERRTYWVY